MLAERLLAILVDRRGVGMTAKQICFVMWSTVEDIEYFGVQIMEYKYEIVKFSDKYPAKIYL